MYILRPSSRYSIRLYVLISITGILLLSVGIMLAWVWSADWTHAVHINQVLQAFVVTILLGYLLSLWIAYRYTVSMSYELNAEEIRIQRGIWVQSIQYIPLLNVAGVIVKKDFLDRCLEIGTLEFMLVSSLNQKIGSVRFVGLSDIDAQFRKLSDLLLHYRGKAMQQSNASALGSHPAIANSPIDLR